MLNFAILGCSDISRKHVEAILKIEQSRLVAVCDIQEEKAKAYSHKLNIPYYTNYHEMLKHEAIDVVNILTPSGLHAMHTIDIVKKYNKHIVCEKPMALSLKDAEEMIQVCKDHKVRLFIVKQLRFNQPIQKLKEIIDTGRLGKLVLGTVRMRWARHQSYYDMNPWRGTWKMDGGCLTNQASHLIDLLQWLMGPPIEVMAMTGTRLVDIEAEDTGVGILKFENGALGVIEATTAARPTSIEGSISILGEKGAVEIGGKTADIIKYWNVEGIDAKEKHELEALNEEGPNIYNSYGHERYLRHVVDCIMNNQQALVDGAEGLKSLEIINALYESAESGEKINLRFKPKLCRLGKG